MSEPIPFSVIVDAARGLPDAERYRPGYGYKVPLRWPELEAFELVSRSVEAVCHIAAFRVERFCKQDFSTRKGFREWHDWVYCP